MKQRLRDTIERWMNSEKIGIVPHLILSLLSFAYSAAVRLRLFMYRSGIFKAFDVRCPVISVGNLTVGGTGKTPVTMAIAEMLMKSGMRPAILSRGYGRSGDGLVVVSDGKEVLSNPMEAGDEPYLMATRLKDVPVIVCADRVRAANHAIDHFKPECLILDDGFQHIRLRRDLNIVLIDGKRGFGNGYLLPRGILREPLTRLNDADLALVKGGPMAVRHSARPNEEMLPVMGFEYRPAGFIDLSNGSDISLEFFTRTNLNKKIMAVAGIASPESFISALNSIGITVSSKRFFPDHHAYTPNDASSLAGSGADVIVTTEKDAVKLRGLAHQLNLPAFALRVEAAFKDAQALKDCIIPVIKRKR